MSVFASFVTEAIEVGGGLVTIRKLNPKQLAEAATAQQLAAVTQARQMREAMGAELMESMSRVTAGEIAQVKAADPLVTYDRITLMRHGVTAWTFDRAIDQAALEDLDDETQTAVAGAILRLSRPSLYQTPDEQEGARKNV